MQDELRCPGCGTPVDEGADLERDECPECGAPFGPAYAAARAAALEQLSAQELRVLFTVVDRSFTGELAAHEATVTQRYDRLLADAFSRGAPPAEPDGHDAAPAERASMPSSPSSALDDVPMYPRWEFCRLDLVHASQTDRGAFYDLSITYFAGPGIHVLLSESDGATARLWEFDLFDYAIAVLGQGGWELVSAQFLQSGAADDAIQPWLKEYGAIAHFKRPVVTGRRIDSPPLLLIPPAR